MNDENHPDYTPGLRKCIENTPRQIGCEAAHFFPVDVDVCQSNKPSHSGEIEQNDGEPRIELETNQEQQRYELQERSRHREERTEEGGTLALHIRSGDIFVQPVHHGYGQASGSCCRPVLLPPAVHLKKPRAHLSRNLVPCARPGIRTKLQTHADTV